MAQHKEFQGKSLDEAIREACEYFGVAREKLEIDIVSDAKSGIFGLVGAKKAVIRAGRVDLRAPEAPDASAGGSGTAAASESGADSGVDSAPASGPEPGNDKGGGRRSARRADGSAEGPAGWGGSAAPGGKKKQPPRREAPAREEAAQTPPEREARNDADAEVFSDGPREESPYNLANCDQERLFAVAREVVLRLVHPIVGEVPCEVSISGARVRAALDCGEAAGLLVGRDGQTLASVQYLAARIISRQVGGAVRLQVDAGNYRERQDDTLKEQALSLAVRVKETGRALSTRPLTAYQRRIVHLALEGDGAVQTHSKGEGAQRKVVISLRRGSGNGGLTPPDAGGDEPGA